MIKSNYVEDEEKKATKGERKRLRGGKERYPKKQEDMADGAEKNTKKKKRDPRAPKKNLNAWMFFVQDVRPQVVAELGDDGKKVALVTKAAGERWARMSVEEKAPYERMASEDKKRYLAELEEYNSKKES